MDTKDIFEQLASRYDSEERVNVAKIIAAEIRRCLSGTSCKRAMDYGCGTGLVGLELVDLFESMLFVDASPQMVAQVGLKISGIAGAEALCADFGTGPLPERQLDCIILSQVLLHVRAYLPLLERLHGLLTQGGHLIIVDFDKNERVSHDLVHNGFEQEALVAQLRQMGFTDAASHTFHHGKELFMKQDASLFLLDAVK